MNEITAKIIKFLPDEDGVTSIEYALIASLIAIVIVLSVTNVGREVGMLFDKIVAGFETANP